MWQKMIGAGVCESATKYCKLGRIHLLCIVLCSGPRSETADLLITIYWMFFSQLVMQLLLGGKIERPGRQGQVLHTQKGEDIRLQFLEVASS